MRSAEQLRLGFPQPTSREGRHRTRVWVLAGEPGETHRLDSLSRPGPNFRHAFVDAATGFPVFRETDLLLLRAGIGRFKLLVPEQMGGFDPYGPTSRDLLGQVREAISRSRPAPSRGSQAIGILAISFLPGGFDVHRRRTSVMCSPRRRTGLEQVLSALSDRAIRTDAERVVPICRLAERSLSGQVHPALRGLVRRQLADGLLECLPDDASNTAALANYRLAERDFRQCDFLSQSLKARSSYQLSIASSLQGTLPGLRRSGRSGTSWNQGYCVRRLLGCPVEIDAPSIDPRPDQPVRGYRHIGDLDLSERQLGVIIDGGDLDRPRLVAHVKRLPRGLSVSVGLQAEIGAMLGLPCRRPKARGSSLVRAWSDTIRFVPEERTVPARGLATFMAADVVKGRHTVAISVERGPGQGELLRLSF